MPILLLTVAGRKTGSPRTAPAGYLRDQGRWIMAGSAGGMRDEPQWFRNLRSADRAHIEIGGVTRDVTVTVTEGQQREVGWQQILVAYPFFAGYQNKAARQIPVAVLQAAGEPVASLGDD
jgi:deazaflavin-dependent oxidoreductase (nitroreductase family)